MNQKDSDIFKFIVDQKDSDVFKLNGSSHTFNQFVVKILMSEQLRISDHAIIHAILSQNPSIKYQESLIVEMILFILYSILAIN